MAKYYVESGPHFLVVVEARDSIEALFKAFTLDRSAEPLRLADVTIVNERGFVWQRDEHELNGGELVLPTSLILGRAENAKVDFSNPGHSE